jgi:hypothetical protein
MTFRLETRPLCMSDSLLQEDITLAETGDGI